MERKIGEIFEYNGEWYQCVECDSCGKCSLCTTECGNGTKSGLADEVFGECSKIRRSDYKHIIFKKLEKVGEPFTCNYYGDARLVMMQEYQLFGVNVIYCDKVPPMYFTDYKHNRIAIEITEKKEDMEEYKMYDAKEDIPELDKVVDECLFGEDKPNLKPFDIEAAKSGRPVYTRDGQKTRIICFDKKEGFPIVALVETKVNDRISEEIALFNINGRAVSDEIDSKFDLMMSLEKKEGWVNVYDDTPIYDTKEEALNRRSKFRGYIDTIKVSWEE